LAERLPLLPIIISSRTVGSRQANCRLKGFDVATVAALEPEDKDSMVRCWYEAVEPAPARRVAEAEKLLRGIRLSQRIDQLTNQPLLLTTLLLIERELGNLPAGRHRFFQRAVDVLLNWHGDASEPLDSDDALLQLEYVAYAMCDRSAAQLRRDELIELVEHARKEYARVNAPPKHSPEEFLRVLEERTNLLVQAGEVRHNGQEVPKYQFRNTAIQEYLAARALVEGRHPGYDRAVTLADRVARSARRLATRSSDPQVSEHWHEALRLCAAICADEDVDDVLRAIVEPAKGEEAALTERPRAILSAFCLADEPGASPPCGEEILRRFAEQIDARDCRPDPSAATEATLELAQTAWAGPLQAALLAEFLDREPSQRWPAGYLFSLIEERRMPADDAAMADWMAHQVAGTRSLDLNEALRAGLAIWRAAESRRACMSPDLVESLMALFRRGSAASHVASEALYWLLEVESGRGVWRPRGKEYARLVALLRDPDADSEALHSVLGIVARCPSPAAAEACMMLLEHIESRLREAAAEALGAIRDVRAVEPLIACLGSPQSTLRRAAASALGRIADPRAIDALVPLLADESSFVRSSALASVVRIEQDPIDLRLVSRYLDASAPWTDPQEAIDERRIDEAAPLVGLSREEVRMRYERLASRFALVLSWPAFEGAKWENWLSGVVPQAKYDELPPTKTGFPILGVQKVRLRNIRMFEDTGEIDFGDDQRPVRPCTLVLGDNAAGKSTLLQSIAMAALGPDLANQTEKRPDRFLRYGAQRGWIEVLFSLRLAPGDEPRYGGTFCVGLEIQSGQNSFQPMHADDLSFHRHNAAERVDFLRRRARDNFGFVCAYGPWRHLTVGADQLLPEAPKETVDRVISLFDSSFPLMDPDVLDRILGGDLSNLRRTVDRELDEPIRRRMAEALGQLLPAVAIAPDAEPGQFTLFDTPAAIRDLSDGYGSVLSIAGHVLRHALAATEWNTDPTVVHGLLLIDEIDLHLHPEWQRRVLPSLHKVFPNLQVIATSHSPMVAGSVDSSAVLALRRQGPRVHVLANIEPMAGWRADQILTSEMFGLESTRSVEVEAQLERFSELATADWTGPEEENELAEIARQLKVRLPSPPERQEAREAFAMIESACRQRFQQMPREHRERVLREVRLQLQELTSGSRRPE
jgi:hypothetical protein